MSAVRTTSGGCTLTLTAEERDQLLLFLEQALKDTLVEEHRTESPDFREHIERRETVMRGVIDKLRRS